MATQYLPGLNLADAVRECGPLEAAGVWRLVAELGQALSALAAAGVVHRDLKPSNVILTQQGAHVIDFGISQATDSSAITTTGNRVGTPAFMAPEYLREGRCDTASDVFSLACTLVYAATGNAPFGDGTGVDVMHRIAFEEPRPEVMAELAAADPGLAALLSACLAKEPAGRPTPRQLTDAATASGHSSSWQEPLTSRLLARQQGCEALERASSQQTVHLRTPSERPTSPAPGPGFDPPTPPGPGQDGHNRERRKRWKPYLAVAAGIAVGAVAVGAFLLTRPPLDESASDSPTVSAAATPEDAPSSPTPSPSASPSDDGKKVKGDTDGEESPEPAAGNGSAPATDGATPEDDAPTSGSGGTAPSPTPPPTPTKTATAPATPPWISQCTYYSGTELTTRGDKGQRVVQVQCMLTKRGYSVGGSGVDGQFGEDTASAVRLFQSDKGLEVDGDVGPNTWAALRGST
jgi:serine/threonine protein kinase